jgi:tetratricopeptide (TPR) repeat protein
LQSIAESKSNKELLVVQVEPPQHEEGGDYYYRTYAPSFSLSLENNVYVINLSNISRKRTELFTRADILILKNICDPDILPVIAERKQTGKISIYEIADDLGAIPAWNPVHFFYHNKENISLFKKTAASCDAVQFTVSELQRTYGNLNARTAVFPNQISLIPAERKDILRKGLIIGWGGSHGHWEDMKEIAPALTTWFQGHQDVKLYLMCSRNIWDLFRNVPEGQKKLFPTGSLENYYDFLRNLDIGLAPLNDTAFNRSRSDIKFLEYAISEVVPLLQDLTPYKEYVRDCQTGILFNSPQAMLSALDSLYGDRPLRMRIAKQARNYVVRYRLQKDHNKERLNFYLSIFRQTKSEEKYINKMFDLLDKEAGISRCGRYLRLLPTLFENCLYNGLIFSQIEHDSLQACSMFEQAKDIEPQNYLPYLFGAAVMPDTIKSLEQAVNLNPCSVRSLLLLGEQYAARNDIVNAVKYFEMAASLFPAYEIPYLRAAQALKTIGLDEQAEELFIKAQSLLLN